MSAQLTNHESETKNSTQSFLSGKLAQVDIGKIEKELQSLWRMAGKFGQRAKSRFFFSFCYARLRDELHSLQ